MAGQGAPLAAYPASFFEHAGRRLRGFVASALAYRNYRPASSEVRRRTGRPLGTRRASQPERRPSVKSAGRSNRLARFAGGI
jgi:hypothetical protein